MSLRTRLANVFRPARLNREIDEEFASHIAEAIEHGQDPAQARRAFGSLLRQREASRDVRLVVWLDSLRADALFGLRQLTKHKVTSAAAILSLALGIGSCTAAFRLIDALLLRPLPVAEPERLFALNRHALGFDGRPQSFDGWAYPAFRLMRAAVKDRAELIAVSYAERVDLTYRADPDMEKATLQYVSGWMFGEFGLKPAAGRLFTENDDTKPGGHPYAVLSHDYWARRFGSDPAIVGRTFRLGDTLYQIVGICAAPFTGTETGTVTDIFIPVMMNPAAVRDDNTWHRTLARLHPGVDPEPVRARLQATSRAFDLNRAKGFSGMSQLFIDRFLNQTLLLDSAAAGFSGMQHDYRRALLACGLLGLLVLLIACANVANLMTAQGAARAREMALRVSIGAGRTRLMQLVLLESAWVALLSAVLGALFAWWAAPFVVSRINPPDNPARLVLPADGRVLFFGIALTLLVTLLFGLAPALRASAVRPAATLRGGSATVPRRRLMHGLIAVQVAFCFLVLFTAGLFAATFQNLEHRPFGFSVDRLLTLETTTRRPESAVLWDQVADRLRTLPEVETVAASGWTLLGNNAWNGFVSVNGAPPGPVLAYFLGVSPGWLDAMKIRLVEGRDFGPQDTSPGQAVVNQTFVREYFPGRSPLGQVFAKGKDRYEIVGVSADAPYRNLREPILPVAFVPIHTLSANGVLQPRRNLTYIVRTRNQNPLALAAQLRREVPAANPAFRVANVSTYAAIVSAQTIRERLMAMLGIFFAIVALLLAAVGLYGVLDYSVLQRRREIGIRIAIGAQSGEIARRVTSDVFLMVFAGGLAGLGAAWGSAQYLDSLLYGVKPGDTAMLALPALTILAAALAATIPPVLRAIRVDPAKTLRID